MSSRQKYNPMATKREVFEAMQRSGLEQAAIQAGQLATALGTRITAVTVQERDGTRTEWRK